MGHILAFQPVLLKLFLLAVMVASSGDGLLVMGFSVTPLLGLCISGWLWEEFAPARSVP